MQTKVSETPQGARRNLAFKFRWPIHQTSENEVVMEVPVALEGRPLLIPDVSLCEQLKLSEPEVSEMMDVALDAALRNIAIVKQ